jgi:signal transduction histidine kinase
LNGILGYAVLLELDGGLNSAQAQKAERIKAGCRHFATMTEQILNFARLDGGHEVVHAESLDAREIAREAGVLVESAANAKGLTFVLDVPDAPVPLITDGGKVRQILVNLCGNAVKYSGEGEVRLRVRAEADRVIVDVRDSGMGIAPQYHARIFERFWQVDGGLTRAGPGMGIGLAASKEYARLLGGDVEVDSMLGGGSTFYLWLPGCSVSTRKWLLFWR